jgi:hypothetical protein
VFLTGGAALSVSADGIVVGTQAGLGGPVTVNASPNAFEISGSGPSAGDPFGFLPRLSLLCGAASCLPGDALPTASFPLGDFSDLDAFWQLPDGFNAVRFRLTDLALAATAVPEPSGAGVILLAVALSFALGKVSAALRLARPARGGGR